MGFSIPDRVGDMTGEQFGASVLNNVGTVREKAILQQVVLGNVPQFMREPVSVSITEGGHSVVLQVLPDYLCVGTDENFLRMPMYPSTAQQVADLFNAMLPSRKIVDAVWKAATIHVTPRTLPPTSHMVSTDAYVTHNTVIETQRAGRLGLMAGHKKDIVLTPQLARANGQGHVAIYGWHYPNGTVIQPLNSVSHSSSYVDYSHGVRLVGQDVLLDGQPAKLADLLQDKDLCGLVSDEGISAFLRYPTG